MNDKTKLLTLHQAEKMPGVYQLVDDSGVFNFRLMAKIDNEKNLRDAMARIHEDKLIALVVLQNPFPENQ